MKRVLAALAVGMALSGCVTGGGVSANNGAALTPAESAFVGDWGGRLPSGKPVRIVVTPSGGVSYHYQNKLQTVSAVKLTGSRLSFAAGSNGSTVGMTADGAYTFVWGPTGETTRATLRKS